MAHIFLFQAYYKKGKYDQAREAILKARVGTRGDFGIYYYLACLDLLQGEYGQAEKDIQYSLMLYSESPASYVLLGQIYEKQGRHDKAIDVYIKATQLNPSLTEAKERLANAYNAVGKIEDAARIQKGHRQGLE
jgi:tetratricopeptide (TPR) repeat protein